MGYLFAQLWPAIVACLVLGFATGWWIWRQEGESDGETAYAAPYLPPAPPEDERVEEDIAQAANEPEIGEEPEPLELTEAEAAPDSADDIAPVAAVADAVDEDSPEVTADEAEVAEPTEETSSPFLAAPDGEPDNLTQIKGVGPKLNDLLHELGVYHFSQIAQWNAEQVAEVDSHLGSFKGRIERDRWIDQARYLAAGDVAGFEHEFGPLNGHR